MKMGERFPRSQVIGVGTSSRSLFRRSLAFDAYYSALSLMTDLVPSETE